MSNRYSLTLRVDFTAGDDTAARSTVTRNLDALEQTANELRSITGTTGQVGTLVELQLDRRAAVKLKLQRLNDDAPPRALVVETL